MTVVILGATDDCRVLVTDAIMGMRDGFSSHEDCCLAEKISSLSFDDTWFACAGSRVVAQSAGAVGNWAKHNGLVFDLATPKTIDDVTTAADRLQRAQRLGYPDMPHPQSTSLFVVQRHRAFAWEIAFDTASGRYRRETSEPFIVQPGRMLLAYGERPRQGPFPFQDAATLIDDVIATMREHDKERRSVGQGLPYELTDRFGAVLVPVNPREEATVRFPFRDLTDAFAGIVGTPEGWALMNDPEYRWSPR